VTKGRRRRPRSPMPPPPVLDKFVQISILFKFLPCPQQCELSENLNGYS
jgi:hypothetical protein